MSEHDEQKAVIDWARLNISRWPCLEWMFAIPNGAQYGRDEKVAFIQAMKLRAEGLLPGVPDLFLPAPRRGYAGFFIEMKAPGKLNAVRDGQAEFMAYAESAGYLCQVHDSSMSAIEALEWYLSEPIMPALVDAWDASIKVDA